MYTYTGPRGQLVTTVPRFEYLPAYVARAHRRVPHPPAFLYMAEIEIETRKQVEELVDFIHTCIYLASQTAFDGIPVRSYSDVYMTCDDVLDELIYWVRLAIGFFDDNFYDVNRELEITLELLKLARNDEGTDPRSGMSVRFTVLDDLLKSLERDI
jgi:hypothetical protein